MENPETVNNLHYTLLLLIRRVRRFGKVAKGTFTLHFATINTEDEEEEKINTKNLHYTLLLLIQERSLI